MFDKLAVLFVLVAVTLSSVDGLPRKDFHREDMEYMHDREFRMWVYEHYDVHMMEHWAKFYDTWRMNADFVKEHNSMGDFSFKLSLNKFAHMNVSDMVKKEHFVMRKPVKEFRFKKFVVPTMVDWRKMGFIRPVKDHTMYNFTHLFPILDSIDAMWAMSHYDREHKHFDWASFDMFKDCCWKEGHMWNLSYYDCVVRHGGLAKEVDYKSPEHMCMSHMFPAFMKMTGARYVEPMDERALAIAVARQPIAVAVDARHESFQFYKEGIYYEPFCSHEEMNHAMLLVGYGFKDGKRYWILKNSWGESWGMDGYMFMAKDMDNHCGIASEAMYPF